VSPTPEVIRLSRGAGTLSPGSVAATAVTGTLMDEYIDELLDERAPLREPLSDEPDEEGFEL
jgi:hypothetical protein